MAEPHPVEAKTLRPGRKGSARGGDLGRGGRPCAMVCRAWRIWRSQPPCPTTFYEMPSDPGPPRGLRRKPFFDMSEVGYHRGRIGASPVRGVVARARGTLVDWLRCGDPASGRGALAARAGARRRGLRQRRRAARWTHRRGRSSAPRSLSTCAPIRRRVGRPRVLGVRRAQRRRPGAHDDRRPRKRDPSAPPNSPCWSGNAEPVLPFPT